MNKLILLLLLFCLPVFAGNYSKNYRNFMLQNTGTNAVVLPDVLDGIVGWWKFDEAGGSTNYNEVVHQETLSFLGTPTWTNRLSNTVAYLNGSSYLVTDKFDQWTSGYLCGAGPVSYSMWFNISTYTSANLLDTLNPGGYGYRDKSIAVLVNGSGNIQLWNKGAFRLTSSGIVPLNTWTHLTITYSSGGEWTYYLNGAYDNKVTWAMDDFGYKILIGKLADGPSYATGSFSDIGVYDHCLTTGEVSTIYAGNPSNINGCVRYWKLNEGTGAKCVNYVSNRKNLVAIGTDSRVTGVSGNAFYCNGTTYLGIPPVVVSPSGNSYYTGYYWGVTESRSYSIWVKPDSLSDYHMIFETERIEVGGGRYDAFVLYTMQTTGQVYLFFDGANRISGIHPIQAGVWNHYVLTYRNGWFTLYHNGIYEGQVNYGQVDFGGDVVLGRFADNVTRSHTAYDDARMYNKELSADEVLKIYNKLKP